MQQFVFPAILYRDTEGKGYTIIFHDLNICTEGRTVEDAFLRAKDFLDVYCRCALQYNGEMEPATKYEDVVTDKNNIVLLVDSQIDDGVSAQVTNNFSFDV